MPRKVNCIYWTNFNGCKHPQRESFLQKIYRKFFLSKENKMQIALGTKEYSECICFHSYCNIYAASVCEFKVEHRWI